MNRRTALASSLFLGSLWPASVLAQERARRVAKTRARSLEPTPNTDDPDASRAPETADPPANFGGEPGFQWRTYKIGDYTRQARNQDNPQKALIEWIMKRTGAGEWHGEKIAALAASPNLLRAYNSPAVLKQVDEIVERFTNSVADVLSVHVQFIAAVDTRWRYSVLSRLTPVGSGPQGQQIWTLKTADAAIVLSTMQLQQGFRKLAEQRVEMINGQTLVVKTKETRTFTGGLMRDSAPGLGFQPRPDKLDESIILKMSPLLNFDGDALDAMLDLTATTIRQFHRTKIIAPREIGPSETAVDVPEATETHLDQTLKNWRLGQTLLISAGIHPGILDKKGGWFNLPIPGTYATGTEVLVFLDVETVSNRSAEPRPAREGRPQEDAAARSRDEIDR